MVGLGLDSRREELLGAGDLETAVRQIWNVADFDLEALVPDPRPSPEFGSLADRVGEHLLATGTADPAEVVLNHVAAVLSRDPIIEPRTADFLAFVFNDDFGDGLRRNIEIAATDEALTRLRGRHLLPPKGDVAVSGEEDWSLEDEG